MIARFNCGRKVRCHIGAVENGWSESRSPVRRNRLTSLHLNITVNNSGEFTFPTSSSGSSSGAINYISAAQSWPVPYEYPYKSALKAFWAAVVAHFKSTASFTYLPQLNYVRFGGSVGSEWFPYCTTNSGSGGYLENLSAPYKYRKSVTDSTYTGWLDYYSEMASYLQTLNPLFKVGWSINSAENPVDYCYGNSQAATAVASINGIGARNGFGSQGLSAVDYQNCVGMHTCTTPSCPSQPTYPSASNWYPNFLSDKGSTSILELQQAAISYPNDTTCSNSCGTGDGHYSGDLKTWLPFAVSSGATDIEVYWRDLELAYGDTGYCTLTPTGGACTTGSISIGNQLTSTDQLTFFKSVGTGTSCGSSQGTHASGDCSYAAAVKAAQGPH